MLLNERCICFEKDFSVEEQRGTCCLRNECGKFFVDHNIPIFKGAGRTFVEDILNKFPEEE